jgi:integrase
MGYVKKEKNGTYTAHYDRPTATGRGATCKRGFKRKRDADGFLIDVEKAVRDKTYVPNTGITLTDYIASVWMPRELDAKIRAGRKSPGTKSFYENVFGRKFQAFFADVPLQRLDADMVEAYLDRRRADGLGGNTVAGHYKALRTVLKYAVRHNDIARNPVEDIDEPPRCSKPKIAFWDPGTIPAALALFKDSPIEWHVRIALLTLLREGEVCGLHEDAFDFRRMEFEVREQATRLRRGGQLFGPPKSDASGATLPLTEEVAALVSARMVANREARLKYGRVYSEEHVGRLSVGGDGRLIGPEALYQQFRRTLKSQDEIPYITFHGLRHTGAVWHVSKGTSLKVLQRLLRHSDFGTTADTYADATDALMREASEKLSLR